MPRYTTSIRMKAPLADVFSVFSDPSSAAKCLSRVQRVERIGEPSSGLDAMYREWRVLENGQEIVQDFRVVEFELERRCTLESVSAGIRFTFATMFERASDDTVVNISVRAKAVTVAAKLLLPIVWMLTNAEAKRSLAHDLAELKVCLERDARAPITAR